MGNRTTLGSPAVDAHCLRLTEYITENLGKLYTLVELERFRFVP